MTSHCPPGPRACSGGGRRRLALRRRGPSRAHQTGGSQPAPLPRPARVRLSGRGSGLRPVEGDGLRVPTPKPGTRVINERPSVSTGVPWSTSSRWPCGLFPRALPLSSASHEGLPGSWLWWQEQPVLHRVQGHTAQLRGGQGPARWTPRPDSEAEERVLFFQVLTSSYFTRKIVMSKRLTC